jgi:hypothetical protein
LTLRAAGRAGVLVIVASLAVACGSAAVSPSASASSRALASAPASLPPPESQLPPSASDTPEPSVNRHGVPDLEALLPASVGNVQLERLSLTGPDFYALGTPDTQGQLDAMLKALGKTTADLSVGDAGDPTGRAILEIGVFRVAGAESSKLLAQWLASNEASSPGRISVTNETIDGRALTKLVDATRDVGGTTRAFVKGDTIFLVKADDPAFVSDALAQLPKP